MSNVAPGRQRGDVPVTEHVIIHRITGCRKR